MSARGGLAGRLSPAAGKLARFATIGALSTLLFAALGLLFAHGLGVPPLGATVSAYACASVFSYLAHRRVTFRSGCAHAVAAPRFVVTTLTGLGLAALLTVVTERLGLPYGFAVAVTCVAVPVFNFVALDRMVFGGSARNGASS